MRIVRNLLWASCVASLLVGCGGGGSTGASVNNSTARGTLIESPPLRTASVTATDFTAQLNATASGQSLLQVAGTPTCGVDFHYIQYATVGGAGEPTTSTGVLMIPTGSPSCTGARPIVLYAHGTATSKSYNLAAISDTTNAANGESALIAATFAARGYIVVAPNYAGYDTSPLPYHPYLNADQQSKEMIDALTAARSALGHVYASTTTDNHKLFITGYSEGGHVAMATQRAMENLNLTVTAAAPMSGPYAMEAFGDAVFFGNVNLGSTVFGPLLTTSYQKAYSNIYSLTTDIYSTAYATGIETLLPSLTPVATLFQQNKLPQTAFFNSVAPTTGGQNALLDALFPTITPPTTPAAQAPLFALGFSASNYLINNNYRLAYVADAATNPDGAVPTAVSGVPATSPANTLRRAFKTNDMRNWVPKASVLLCGGHSDPTVYYNVNTQVMQAFWGKQTWIAPVPLQVVDVDGGSSPVGTLQLGFAQAEQATATAAVQAGATDGGTSAVTQAYHGTLVPPFCSAAARTFFSQF